MIELLALAELDSHIFFFVTLQRSQSDYTHTFTLVACTLSGLTFRPVLELLVLRLAGFSGYLEVLLGVSSSCCSICSPLAFSFLSCQFESSIPFSFVGLLSVCLLATFSTHELDDDCIN